MSKYLRIYCRTVMFRRLYSPPKVVSITEISPGFIVNLVQLRIHTCCLLSASKMIFSQTFSFHPCTAISIDHLPQLLHITGRQKCYFQLINNMYDNNNNNNNNKFPETRKYWVDVHWEIVSSHGERDPL